MSAAGSSHIDPGVAATFAHRLQTFGDAIAVITDDGQSISYAELARRADQFAATLGAQRRLVLVEAANHIDPLVAYLGALRGGHAVVLAAARGNNTGLRDTFRPSARFGLEGERWSLQTDDAGVLLHPDLAVLLSTSGTTGATKLVRLSGGAVDANAASIVEYLGLTSADRAITSLPFHYSYGLSVVNSHLSVGATLLLTDRSVVDPAFWSFFEAHQGSSIAGVPYTYELLDRSGFLENAPASLRTMTQAGGRLAPDTVVRFGGWAQARGVKFFVMYGQTEATARMAYLRPDEVVVRAGDIGRAIPGGAFRLVDADGKAIETPDTVGELVYRGPNVMMGYATRPEDLERGHELTELHTGDLARRDADGVYRIVGRKSRFAKIYGLRISLDDVEARIGHLGYRGIAVSDDAVVYVAVLGEADGPRVQADLSSHYKLPAAAFYVEAVAEWPTLPSGKVDYRTILRDAQARAASVVAPADDRHAIAAAFAQAFPRRDVQPDDTFVGLGGDSLNYVNLSLAIEGVLGFLPDGWEKLPLRQLCDMTPRGRPLRWWSLRTIETEVVIRMFAILAVVVNHASSWVVGGGAEVLLILAGYNLGRYQKARLADGKGYAVVLNFAQRILAPYYVILVAYLVMKRTFDAPSLLLVSNFFGRFGSLIEPFWFIEAMFQCFVVVALLSLFKPVRRAIANDPWRFGLVCLAAALALKGVATRLFDHAYLANRTPDATLFLLALGWCVNEATTHGRRVTMTAVLVGLAVVQVTGIPGVFDAYAPPTNYSHAAWLGACAVGLLWIRRLALPNVLHAIVGAIAAASFYIYLTHVVVLWIIYWRLGFHDLTTNLCASVALGLLAWWAVGRIAELRPAPPSRAAI